VSDSLLPIPSGYFCHTSCAVGKGAATAALRLSSLSLSLSLSLFLRHPPPTYSATPISPPRANIYRSPSKASFRALSLFARPANVSTFHETIIKERAAAEGWDEEKRKERKKEKKTSQSPS